MSSIERIKIGKGTTNRLSHMEWFADRDLALNLTKMG
jgi:hypothetical protein